MLLRWKYNFSQDLVDAINAMRHKCSHLRDECHDFADKVLDADGSYLRLQDLPWKTHAHGRGGKIIGKGPVPKAKAAPTLPLKKSNVKAAAPPTAKAMSMQAATTPKSKSKSKKAQAKKGAGHASQSLLQ